MAQLSCCGVCDEVCGGAQRWKCKVGVFPCFRNYRPGHVEVQKQPLAVLCISFLGWRRQEVARISQIQRSQNAPGRVDANLDGAFIEMSCTSLAVHDTTKTAARVSSLLDSVAEEPHNDLQDLPFSRSRASGRNIERLCSQGHLNGALDVLSFMYQQGDTPSVADYSCVLKACTSRKALSQVKRVGAYLAKHRLLKSTRFLGENLVMALVKCGGLEDALQVFNSLPNKGVFSWTAMISGYSAAGQGRKALSMYNFMQQEGLCPDKYTFVSLLKACGSIPDLEEGKRIHAEVLTHRLGFDLFVGTCLVDMYAKCGSLVDAKNVFDGLPQRDVVSWTAMLAAYAQQGQVEEAFRLFEQMQDDGMQPGSRAFVSVLQACGMLAETEETAIVDGRSMRLQSLGKGKVVHAAAWREGHYVDLFVGNCLVSMYGKCGSIVDAQIVFTSLHHQDVVTWTAMLTAYLQQDQADKAFQQYLQMLEEAISPNDRTVVSALQACSQLADKEVAEPINWRLLQLGKAIHAEAQRKLYASDVFVLNTLVSMYGKCRSIVDALNVFHGVSHPEVVTWTAMLAAYVEQGQAAEALQLYVSMLESGVSPNDRTFVSVIQACGILAEKEECVKANVRTTKVKSLERGKAIHAHALRKGCNADVFVGNTLVSMYGKCGSVVDAQHVFDGLIERDVVSWNVMIAAYAQQGQGEKALQLYRKMLEENLSSNELTIVSVLHACSSTGSLDICKQIHQKLVSVCSDVGPLILSSLIHAFGRCASMVCAQSLFDAMPQPNVVSWNALIAGYAREGNIATSLYYYEEMRRRNVNPNGVTFISLLSACSHAGLVDKGVQYFESMGKDHGITPDIEHYVSMVDLLGRAGLFSGVEALLTTMPLHPNLSMWLCLLGACRKHGKVVLAKQAFHSARRLHPNNAAAYLLMYSIYADANMWDGAEEVTVMGHEVGAWKKPPGQSWIEHQQELHIFVVGDRQHSQQHSVYELVEELRAELRKEHTG